MYRYLYSLVLLLSLCLHAQSEPFALLKPSDSLNLYRRNTVVLTTAGLATTALVGLNQLWYSDYPQSKFHVINDNNEWMQMDKAGHLLSCYHLSRLSAASYRWAGMSQKSQLLYGAASSWAFMSVVEVFDGYSAAWGASWGDVVANTAGSVLFVGQELLWKDQRIIPKFSFHQT